MAAAPSTTVQKLLLVVSILMTAAGLGLTFAGLFSPAWQVVDIREFRAEHQHGLWWDCTRAEKHVVSVGDFYDEAPLHCIYKFDQSAELVIENTLQGIDQDGAAGESEHHKFWGWHKITLFLIICSHIAAFTSICTGICAPCFRPSTFVFTISLLAAMIMSILADGIAFFSMNRVDTRFVQGMVGTYEQRIGYAFYLHIAGSFCLIIAFCAALVTTYEFLTDKSGARRRPYEMAPQFQHQYKPDYPTNAAGEPLLPASSYHHQQQMMYNQQNNQQQQQQHHHYPQQQQQQQQHHQPYPRPTGGPGGGGAGAGNFIQNGAKAARKAPTPIIRKH